MVTIARITTSPAVVRAAYSLTGFGNFSDVGSTVTTVMGSDLRDKCSPHGGVLSRIGNILRVGADRRVRR
ncbi:hypothetical protein GCM10007298_31090 [Williamsia phyllosphaerae]|uniref:Uncharacterized protein n=1 Tax=Williamsia phyllosphaerae TaxID=885042 RepID=A0ABQ1V2R5_9NOCA|nr:hypothetical protein GCM10007298_31090 [Williamsia phyllosphaerae]